VGFKKFDFYLPN
jgi:hypothetical protein